MAIQFTGVEVGVGGKNRVNGVGVERARGGKYGIWEGWSLGGNLQIDMQLESCRFFLSLLAYTGTKDNNSSDKGY